MVKPLTSAGMLVTMVALYHILQPSQCSAGLRLGGGGDLANKSLTRPSWRRGLTRSLTLASLMTMCTGGTVLIVLMMVVTLASLSCTLNAT